MKQWRPAYDEAIAAHVVRSVRLRSSLRAAARLEATNSLERLFQHFDEFRLSTIFDVIETIATDHAAATVLVASLEDQPLAVVRRALLGPAHDVCASLIPHVGKIDARRPTTSKALPWADASRQLY